MKVTSNKKLFGFVCFALSFSLFMLIWMVNKQRAQARKNQIKIYEMEVDHMSSQRKTNCALLLIKMDKNILNGKSIKEYKVVFDQYCFILPPLHGQIGNNLPENSILENFEQLNWCDYTFHTKLDKIRYFIEGHSQQTLNHALIEVRVLLEDKRYEESLAIIQKLPSYVMNDKCKTWITDLEILVESRNLLRIGVCKLFSDKRE